MDPLLGTECHVPISNLKQWRTVHREAVRTWVLREACCIRFLRSKLRFKRYIGQMLVYRIRLFLVLLNQTKSFHKKREKYMH